MKKEKTSGAVVRGLELGNPGFSLVGSSLGQPLTALSGSHSFKPPAQPEVSDRMCIVSRYEGPIKPLPA